MIAAAPVAIAVGMLLVRLGWGGRRGVAVAGWVLAGAMALVLTRENGAWGLAIAAVAGVAAAIAIVLHAGWTAPAKALRPPREAPSITLPRRPRDLARRLAVFVLVVPVAFAAAQWLAFGIQAMARRGGAGEADAIVTMLFLQPLLWSILMAWQMTRAGAVRMIAPPAGAAALGTILWSLS